MVDILWLSNGMPVILEQMDYVRSVSFGVWIRVGSVNETVENNGISHMLEHMFFKGTQKRSAKKLADDTARLGGNLNAYTSKECTAFYATTLDGQLTQAVELLGDMLCNSVFREEDLAREKGVILEEIDMYEDSPEDLVHEMLQKSIWKEHSLGYIISGEKKVVKRFTREEIVAFKNQFYTASNMVLSVAGHFEKERLLEELELQFGSLPPAERTGGYERPGYQACVYRKKKDIEQVHMNIAFDGIDYHSEDKYVLSVINAIVGGGDNSRLFQKIREEMGMAYSIYSYESLFDKAGLFHIDTVLNPMNQKLVFDMIMEQLMEFQEKGASEEELLCTREQIKTELIIGCESTRSRMNSNGREYLYRKKITPIDEVVEKINRVTNEDMIGFAKRYWKPDQYSMALVGNLGSLKNNTNTERRKTK